MRIFTILLTIALIVASCNQKQVSEIDSNGSVEHETIDSLESNQDSLAFWTDDEIVRQHGELVDVAQYIWRMNRDDSVSQNVDFITKEVERINPNLLAYFYKHHKSNNMSEDQKIDSVLSEIKVAYEPMVAGPTMSSMVGLDVHIAVDSYREALLFNRLMRLAQNDILRAALRDEMAKWKAFELNLTSYVSSIARLCFWGGSLSGPASLMAYQGVLNSRIEDQNNLCALLFGKKIVKSADPLKQVEAVFRQSIEQALDSVSHEDHSEMYVEESDSLYVEKYQETQNLQNDIKNSLSQWLKTRERLGLVANLPQNEYQRTTAKFLANLSKEITAAATY